MVIRYFGVAIFVTFFLNVYCIQAEPKLWVEKNPVTAGESFRMFVEVENDDDPEEPNLSLIKDIKVLNRSVQNQTSIVGTSISRKVSWTYEVVAMSPGSIQIPALRVGNAIPGRYYWRCFNSQNPVMLRKFSFLRRILNRNRSILNSNLC